MKITGLHTGSRKLYNNSSNNEIDLDTNLLTRKLQIEDNLETICQNGIFNLNYVLPTV